jgi:hypothetical protein
VLGTKIAVPFPNPPGRRSRLKQLISSGQELAYGRGDEVELNRSE